MDEMRRGDATTIDRGEGQPPSSSPSPRPSQRSEARAAAADDGRGRSTEKPSEIPARGWKDILWRVYAGISDDRILANAS